MRFQGNCLGVPGLWEKWCTVDNTSNGAIFEGKAENNIMFAKIGSWRLQTEVRNFFFLWGILGVSQITLTRWGFKEIVWECLVFEKSGAQSITLCDTEKRNNTSKMLTWIPAGLNALQLELRNRSFNYSKEPIKTVTFPKYELLTLKTCNFRDIWYS